MALSELPSTADVPVLRETATAKPRRTVSSVRSSVYALLTIALTSVGYWLVSTDCAQPQELEAPTNVSPNARRYFGDLPDGNIFYIRFITVDRNNGEVHGKFFHGPKGELSLEVDGHVLTADDSMVAAHGEPGKKVGSIHKESADFAARLQPPLKGGKLLVSSDVLSDIATTLRNNREKRPETINVMVDYRIVIDGLLLDMLVPKDMMPREGSRIITFKVRYPEIPSPSAVPMR